MTGGRWQNMRTFAPLLLLLPGLAAGCEQAQTDARATEKSAPRRAAAVAGTNDPCTSGVDLTPIKTAVFTKAKTVGAQPAPMLDQLASAAVVRMERPTEKSRDPALAVSVCRGTLVVDLPPGSADAFTGGNQLSAPIDYAVQRGRDGVTRVHQLGSADAIVYRLAAIGLAARPQQGAATAEAGAVSGSPGVRRAAAAPAQQAAAPRVAAAPQPRRRAPAARPSFDCRTAQSRAEQMVCTDAYLANLDRELVYQYSRAYTSGSIERRERLERTRGRFLARLDRCERWACVEDVYQDRIEQVVRIARRD